MANAQEQRVIATVVDVGVDMQLGRGETAAESTQELVVSASNEGQALISASFEVTITRSIIHSV